MRNRVVLLASSLLGACGGGSGGGGGEVASTPAVSAAAPAPAPTPAPVPQGVNHDTSEYRRSNAAVQAQAIAAYSVGATGSGIVVGIIDSGVAADSAEFAGRISPLSRDYAGTRPLGDDGGHGTAVATVLLGARNGTSVHGIAFDATLLALRTDTPGTCVSNTTDGGGCTHTDNAMAAALDGAVAARARVVNMSLGGGPANNALRAAIGRATAAGIVIVISAGNDGVRNANAAVDPDMLAQIAIDPLARGQIIIAGATDGNGALADFSNKAGVASATYLTALGTRVRSMDQTGTAYLYSGTSFATPVIAGAAALLAQAFPNLSGAQIVALLLRTATDLGAAGVDPVFGHGELNLSRAFAPQGSTTLANTSVGVSLTGNATLGAAMGDAAGSASASIRDGYGRDYAVDLSGTIARTTPSYALGQALQIGSRSMGARVGRASLALAIADGVAVPQRLLLDRADAGRARLLAGAVALGLGKTTRLGIGIGRGSDGLMPTSIDAATPAFLIGDRSLDRAPLAAFALRQSMGGIGLTVAAENGELRLWQAGATGPHSNGWQRYGYSQTALGLDARHGRFALATRLTRLHEKATILGGRFDAALGGGGATSWFADAEAMVDFGSGWRLIGALRHGLTDADSGALRTASRLSSRALSASVIKTGIFGRDSLALRYAEPLRVTGGALMLTLPGTAIQALSLTPQGHERDLEAAYMRPLGGGFVTLNAYRRVQPGHWVNAPTETGAALRWSSEF